MLLAWLWPQNLHGSTAYIGVAGHSMDGTYRSGDLIVVRRQATYRVGDIVAYTIPAHEFGAGAHVIHRIVGGNATLGYATKGDNRTINDPWRPRNSDVLGRSWLRIPGLGNGIQKLAHPVPLGVLCGGIAILSLFTASQEEPVSKRRQGAAPRLIARVNLHPARASASAVHRQPQLTLFSWLTHRYSGQSEPRPWPTSRRHKRCRHGG